MFRKLLKKHTMISGISEHLKHLFRLQTEPQIIYLIQKLYLKMHQALCCNNRSFNF